jgi:hypothetical protein
MSQERVSRVIAVLLAAANSTKVLVAAPAADSGLSIYIQRIHWSIVTAAAQLTKVGEDGGGEDDQLLEFAESAAGNGTRDFTGVGFKLPAETALSAKPASAGPAIHFVVEYTIEL